MSHLEHTESKGPIGAPRRAGRPKFEPTDKDRRYVTSMAGFRIPHEDIAEVMGINRKTLQKAFRYELKTARMQVTSTILTKYHEALDRGEQWAITWGLKFYLGFKDDPTSIAVSAQAGRTAESLGIRVEFVTAAPKPDDPLPPGGQYDPRAPRPISRREMYDAANTAFPHRIDAQAKKG